jgi:hypothetical protein
MTNWNTFQVPITCGRCGHRVEAGARVVQIRITGMKRALLRCLTCAEQQPTVDLPPDTVPLAPVQLQTFPSFSWVKLIDVEPEDFKAKAANDVMEF